MKIQTKQRRTGLIEFRKKAGTQIEVAKKLGISRSHLSSIEVGARDPSLKVMRMMIEILDVSEKDLIDALRN